MAQTFNIGQCQLRVARYEMLERPALHRRELQNERAGDLGVAHVQCERVQFKRLETRSREDGLDPRP